MVCHETYKDENNNWISPDEITSINGKKYLKNNKIRSQSRFIRVYVKIKKKHN
jgi:hypothetical protein